MRTCAHFQGSGGYQPLLGANVAQDIDGGYSLNLLQCWQLRRGGTEIRLAWRQQRLIAALAILGARPRRYLSGLLWPERPEARAKESLRTSVYLASSQAPGLIASDGQLLSLSDRVTVDLHQVAKTIGYSEEQGSELTTEDRLACLQCGDLLPGWYDEWVFVEQQRLRNSRLRAFLILAGKWLDDEEAHRAAQAAESALELEPLHERAVALLMQAELKAGNRARALRTFEMFRNNLQLELGVEPSDHLARLAAAIYATGR